MNINVSNLDKRIAGLDDHTALCIRCGGVMLRQDEDVFMAYFVGDDSMPLPEALKLEVGLNHLTDKFGRVQ